MKRLFAATLCFALSVCAFGATWNVPGDFSSVQEAIDAAADGDAILVGPGTYEENIDFLGKGLILKSTDGPEVTRIDGMSQGSVVILFNGYGKNQQLSGFTIANGKADGAGIDLKNTKALIDGNLITGNHGDGIYCGTYAAPLIRQNVISLNQWGIKCEYTYETTVIEGNAIRKNFKPAIGCYYYASAKITGNAVEENYGHGLWIGIDASAEIIGNRIEANGQAGIGSFGAKSMSIATNRIMSNQSGIQLFSIPSAFVVNNLVAGSSGYGCVFDHVEEVIFINNTVCGNDWEGGCAGFSAQYSLLTATNCILWDNKSASGHQEIKVWNAEVSIDHSDVQGGQLFVAIDNGNLFWGTGMLDADPLFADESQLDLHLIAPSLCKDAGDPNAPGLPQTDFEGDPRFAYGCVDMGADEFYSHLYFTGKASPGEDITLNLIGDPGKPALLFIGSELLDPPLTTPYGAWYLAPPVIPVALGPLPWWGLIALKARIPAQVVPPVTLQFQAFLGGSLLTNPSTLEILQAGNGRSGVPPL